MPSQRRRGLPRARVLACMHVRTVAAARGARAPQITCSSLAPEVARAAGGGGLRGLLHFNLVTLIDRLPYLTRGGNLVR